ncbi:acyltransferase [Bradyrhizobium sp. Bra64]|uniref:acyltransferase family protein n=1 Tax=Bradyrhizobium sp. Bra64 TaxID=2926009 RepID=UPI0021179F1B|nr:acyltransferase [Bradyrhizobium sp. Bra64]
MEATREKELGIQSARAVAALCIMYFHSWIALVRFPEGAAWQIPVLTKYGWLAVDFFFAISGYVICMVVTKPNFSPTSFLIKRVFRLYPLWLVTLTAFAGMVLVWREPTETETVNHFLLSATLLPTNPLPWYGPGWSLQHEMAFYVLAAVIVPFGGVSGLIAFLLATAVAAHIFPLPWYVSQIALRHPEFLAGILAFLLAPRLKVVGFIFPLTLGLLLLLALMNQFGQEFVAPALFFLVIAFVNLKSPPAVLVVIGDASYSIYLIHMATFFVVSSVTSKITLPWWFAEPLRFLTMAAIIGASFLCWKWFELPMTRYGSRVATLVRREYLPAPTK